MNAPQPNPGKRYAGGVLIAVGGMIFLMCGLCTARVVGANVASLSVGPGAGDAERYNTAWSGLFLFLAPVVGGIPTLTGLAILALGVSQLRDRSSAMPGPVLVGGALMTASAAFAWILGGVLVGLILQNTKYHPNGGASFELILTEIVLDGVVLLALALVWRGLKMVRQRPPKQSARQNGAPTNSE